MNVRRAVATVPLWSPGLRSSTGLPRLRVSLQSVYWLIYFSTKGAGRCERSTHASLCVRRVLPDLSSLRLKMLRIWIRTELRLSVMPADGLATFSKEILRPSSKLLSGKICAADLSVAVFPSAGWPRTSRWLTLMVANHPSSRLSLCAISLDCR